MVALTNIGNSLNGVDVCVSVFEKDTLYVFFQVTEGIRENVQTKIERLFIKTIFSKLSKSHIPDEIVFVKLLPITSHGKVDKKELVRQSSQRSLMHVGWRKHLKECWEMALNMKVSSSTMENTFSQCGGDSFAAVFFLNRLFRCVSLCDVENIYENLFTCVLTSNLTEIEEILETLQKNDSGSSSVGISNNYDIVERNVAINDDVICYEKKHSKSECNHFSAYQKQNHFCTCKCITPVYRCDKSNLYEIPISGKHIVLKLQEKWKYDTQKCVDASPLVVFSADFPHGIVYIGSHARIFTAISLPDGKKIWDTVVHDRVESAAVLSEDGNSVFFGL